MLPYEERDGVTSVPACPPAKTKVTAPPSVPLAVDPHLFKKLKSCE